MQFRFHRAAHATSSVKGFSLIETLIALSVLIVGVLAGFSVISHAIRTAPGTREELVAANLAQEAIEAVRAIRDQRLLKIYDDMRQGSPVVYNWAQDIAHCGAVDAYESRLNLIDKSNISGGWAADSCDMTADWEKVFVEPVSGFMANLCQVGGVGCGSTGWTDVGMRRRIEIAKYVGGARNDSCTTTCTEVQVKVMVYWGGDVMPTMPGGCPAEHCIFMEDRLTNWVDYLMSFAT